MSNGVSMEVLQKIVDAFNDHDLDKLMGFFADECVLEMPRGPSRFGSQYVGKQNFDSDWPEGRPVCRMSTMEILFTSMRNRLSRQGTKRV